jgi:hypothetical protein
MAVEIRPAMPAVMPRVRGLRPGRDQLLRRLATAVTLLTAALAILVVAAATVVLGMT